MHLTVGIATWNRSDLLRQTLESLTALRPPAPAGDTWELIVCDNNSTDATPAVAEGFAGRLPLRYVLERTQGLGHAHNRILKEATGDWLIILDDDVLADPGLLEAYAAAARRYPRAGGLIGQVLPWLETPLRGQSAYLLATFPWVHAVVSFDRDEQSDMGGRKPHGPNMAARRDVLLAMGGFDAGRGMIAGKRVGGEDTQVGINVLKLGHELWSIADARVRHFIPRQRTGLRWFCQWNTGPGLMWVLERGPAPRGLLGLRLWHYRRIVRLLVLAVLRYRRRDPRRAYETLANACAEWGYLRAS